LLMVMLPIPGVPPGADHPPSCAEQVFDCGIDVAKSDCAQATLANMAAPNRMADTPAVLDMISLP
jgi:hypothetical protein